MGETYFDKIYICWNALLVNRDSQQMHAHNVELST